MHSSTIVLESQPDWLTVTVAGVRNVASVVAKVDTLMRGERVGGNRQMPFSLGQYTGTRCGRVRCGQSSDRVLVQLSGDMAATQMFWFLQKAHHVTRLDLAVTVQTVDYQPEQATLAYAEAKAFRAAHPTVAVPSVIVNGAGGQTFYIGKRTGDRYFRLYDKEAECRASGDADATTRYARSWRYELELHDDAATNVAYSLPQHPFRALWIAAYVHRYVSDHGVTPLYSPDQQAAHVGGFRRRSDRESRLDWLCRSVAPTIRWLIDTTPREELLERLGLADTQKGYNVDLNA